MKSPTLTAVCPGSGPVGDPRQRSGEARRPLEGVDARFAWLLLSLRAVASLVRPTSHDGRLWRCCGAAVGLLWIPSMWRRAWVCMGVHDGLKDGLAEPGTGRACACVAVTYSSRSWPVAIPTCTQPAHRTDAVILGSQTEHKLRQHRLTGGAAQLTAAALEARSRPSLSPYSAK